MIKKEAQKIWTLLEQVSDPEIPVLTVIDMGVIRSVKEEADGRVEVVITPTYSGCPAMDMIEVEIRAVLQENGYDNVVVKLVLSPAWTTEWMTESGKKKLKAYGIAPPEGVTVDKNVLFGAAKKIECPRCSSRNTEMLSQFGSTACKSLYQCSDCKEPFDYFKCH
ncbi:MAG: Phenylacetate-CoA oxygenase, PaaJ subunit [uncultured Aureispira sp.]|uniref:Phenylacetate-CoA oxygenase, PaaJ subunit n=1 Tax=uncultured Aureispira sp. TaxID=1331704 RepID=A0A6S6S8U7_9BACT|nr:MAG: Phenylacetate-CoA oxygenase, PaaJ subunit [uncultured Aureispira sp.]